MKYQLVLQWPADSIDDYDAMIEVEKVLDANLSKPHKVDGHDCGSGEANIFIHTSDPQGAFHEVQTFLGSHDFWTDARVAYRELSGSDYSILWPKGLAKFRVA